MRNTVMQQEIGEEVRKGKGCIIFDFGCYYPHKDRKNLVFDFQIGEEELNDKKLNHRYPDYNYQTITKKSGKNVSKIGYPYFFNIDEENGNDLLLCVKVGNKGHVKNHIFPLHLHVTNEKPVCALTLHYLFEESCFEFITWEKEADGGTNLFWYRNIPNKSEAIILSAPRQIETNTFLYKSEIHPISSELENLDIF